MLTSLKELLAALLAPITLPLFYIGVVVTSVMTIFRRAEWSLYALIAVIPLPNIRYRFNPYPYGKDLLDILMFSILVGIFINKNGFKRAPNGALLMLFIVVNYIALWNTSLRFSLPLPITTDNEILSDWKNYAEMIFLYFLVFNCIQNEKHQKIVTTLIAAVMLFIAVREFRNFSEGDVFSYDKRVEGPFWVMGLGANHIGAFVAHYGAALLGLYLLDEHKKRRWLYLAALLFSLHPLFFSYSRGAYVGALAALVFFGVMKKRSLLLLLFAIVILWQTVLPTTVVERISMTESPSGELEPSAGKRLELWDRAIDLYQSNPVFGIGYGGFSYSVKIEGLTDTHSFYLRTLSEQGTIGIVLFGIVLLAALRSGWRLYRLAQTSYLRGLGLGFMGCVVAVLVTNMFGDRWSYFVLGGYFFVLWGVVDRGIRIATESSAAPQGQTAVFGWGDAPAASAPQREGAETPLIDNRT
ncbi:MAG: O-antigen ligase family protein [Burkholderiales bacterium]